MVEACSSRSINQLWQQQTLQQCLPIILYVSQLETFDQSLVGVEIVIQPLLNLLTRQQVQAMRQRVEELVAEEAGRAGEEFRQEEGPVRLANLVNKDPIFEICFTQPLVLAAISHALKWQLETLVAQRTDGHSWRRITKPPC